MSRPPLMHEEETRQVPYDSSGACFRLADRDIVVFAHFLDGETPPEELWKSLVDLQGIGLVGEESELAWLLCGLPGTRRSVSCRAGATCGREAAGA